MFRPFAGGALAGFGTMQPDIEAAAGIVVEVARDPVAPLPASVGKIMPAHGLGVAGEPTREIGDALGHRCLQQKKARQFGGPS